MGIAERMVVATPPLTTHKPLFLFPQAGPCYHQLPMFEALDQGDTSMLPIVCRRSTFRILPPIIVASALLMAVSTNTDRSAAQKSNKGILLVTSYGGPDVRGPDISPEIFAIHFDGS